MLALTLGLSAATVFAQAISPAMIEQFQKLPRAEQERLAKQYGYDLPGAATSSKGSTSVSAPVDTLQQQQRQPETDNRSERPAPQNEAMTNQQPKRFGLALFDNNVSTFAPVTNVPVPESYILGPDDSLMLQLFGKENTDYELTVSRDGSINLPDIGPVNVSGLRFNQARELITERVQNAKIGVSAAVTMGQLRTINIIIAGEAKQPGVYAVSALTTVTQALFVAGGVSDIGSLRNIKVNRGGKTQVNVDLYQLLLQGNNITDINLQHGDVVFVEPVKALIEVNGEVQRPAIYELANNETLADILTMAGGSKAGAYPRNVVLQRFNSNNMRDLLTLDLTMPADANTQAKNGDVLTIAATSPRIERSITVAGAVTRPGQYAWQPGLTVADVLPSLWSGVHMVADLDYALIVRELSNAGNVEVLQFDLGQAITSPGSVSNLALQARDMLLVFPYGDEGYQRKQLYTELKKLTVQSIVEPAALALQETEYGFVTIEQQQQIAYHLNRITSQYTLDSSLLRFTAHLSRSELLTPLLTKLEQQARFNLQPQIAIVTGNVKVAGSYPLAKNGKVSDLITAAGGLAQSAFANRAELTRAIYNDAIGAVEAQHIALNLNAVFSGENNPQLISRDTLNVFETPDWNIKRNITLRGEVRFPGVYAIQQHESLADIINRAGGLSNNAFSNGAVFTRQIIQEAEAEQMKKLISQLRADIAAKALTSSSGPTLPATDANAMLSELEQQKPVGRLVIDLDSIIAGSPQHSIRVQDGDMLTIPRISNTVTVLGEVQHASSHRFDPAMSLNEYLKLAGGLRKRADENRVYVIRADGSVVVPQSNWFAVSSTRLQPGDTIIAPLDTEYKDNLSMWAQVTQIFYQTAVAIAALNSF
ncbi:sugar transporter [Arsukibacterium sp. MJ3]|nr:sugar transporter [Arsukibacterium sp. MJ3]